jgi:hypothetical protein
MTLDFAAIEALVGREIERRAHKAGAWLVDQLSQEGSGVLYEGNPRRSSTPDEYPAAQTEALVGSIDVRPLSPLTQAVGSFADTNAEGYAHALDLETSPPSQGGRPFLEKAVADPELRRVMMEV